MRMDTRVRFGRWAALVGFTIAVAPRLAAQQQGPALARLQVVVPHSVDRAVARGTRSVTGAPGPRYWQNSADYQIAADVTPADSMLRGEEAVTYHNASPDTLPFVVFHVYQNLMGPNAARQQPAPGATRGMVIDRLEADRQRVEVPDNMVGRDRGPGMAAVLGTEMLVRLPSPLLPGGQATFHILWHFKIPPSYAPRMGMQDGTTAQIAQWYPQIAVYDDLHGWDRQQYVGSGEFYLDYGHFTYSVTLPAGFIVGGTGVLTNADQVLTAGERAALQRAASSDQVVHVLAADQFGPGTATMGKAGDRLTWRFDADSVRDVAFSFGDHYLWDATRAMVDSATHRYAAVNVFYRQGAPRFDQVALMARSALETHSSRMVPYPYPQLTETEGGRGGMEYPMTVFVGADSGLYREDMVTAHEIGHEWFPMLVGSNETRYGWMDEGLNTFDTYFATDAYLPPSFTGYGVKDDYDTYVAFLKNADEDLQIMSPANAFGVVDAGYDIEAYSKPANALWALRSILGDGAFYRAYRVYIHRWAYKHPSPWDFFRTFDDVTGQDLDWFWQPWFFSREWLDQAVTAVRPQGHELAVTVQNKGGLYAPVDVTATLADGGKVSWRAPASVWFGGAQTIITRHAVPGRVTAVTLDAEQSFPDVDRTNNSWTAGE
jgi:Peptidase family M1 domain